MFAPGTGDQMKRTLPSNKLQISLGLTMKETTKYITNLTYSLKKKNVMLKKFCKVFVVPCYAVSSLSGTNLSVTAEVTYSVRTKRS